MSRSVCFSDMVNQYLVVGGCGAPVVSDISKTSYSDKSGCSLCSSSLKVIDMDASARNNGE